ncbi:cytochrome P450 [Actinomadura soli]|uniref:cytochrome P450 n=1 Tax=Actinomadura soli TaxID=2508997 RepID=UPI00197ABB01|nr:cytochrome P450 [Actinomadura soli]
MVAGGNDTTGNLISHGVALLDGDHVQRERLAADLSLVPNALMEFLRLEGSVQALARTTTRPVTLHGTQIPAGEKVMMLFGAANRDEREFGPSANDLDITREIPRHLGFSSGVHFCIGSHLAKLQARVALEESSRRTRTWASTQRTLNGSRPRSPVAGCRSQPRALRPLSPCAGTGSRSAGRTSP